MNGGANSRVEFYGARETRETGKLVSKVGISKTSEEEEI